MKIRIDNDALMHELLAGRPFYIEGHINDQYDKVGEPFDERMYIKYNSVPRITKIGDIVYTLMKDGVVIPDLFFYGDRNLDLRLIVKLSHPNNIFQKTADYFVSNSSLYFWEDNQTPHRITDE